jgi:hypothetical protein
MIKKLFVLTIFSTLIIISSCGDYKLVPDSQFIGTWELTGRPMFDGIKIKIEKAGDNDFKGRIVKLNENKFVAMFADTNDVWVSEIKRSSNFKFKLTEKRIGRQLFSLYGLGSSDEFSVEFINEDSFGLGEGNSDPLNSDIIYKRVK